MQDRPASFTPETAIRSLCVIFNERASEDADMREAVHVLRSRGHRLDQYTAEEPADVSRLAAEAVRAGVDAVVAAGGDGTLNQVVNGVLALKGAANRRSGVGVVPFGTANDFAAACGIPLENPLEALELVVGSQARSIDVGRANGRYFLNVASGGCAAEVTTETSPEVKRLLGGFAYFLTGLTTVMNLDPRYMRVRASDFQWEGPALALLIANGRQAGGGFRIAPQARLDDGLLNLVIIPERPLDQLITLLGEWRQLDAQHVEFEYLVKHEAAWLDVIAPGGLQINLDGEPMHGEVFHFETAARRLPFYLPSPVPA